jgi:hypothetical protein
MLMQMDVLYPVPVSLRKYWVNGQMKARATGMVMIQLVAQEPNYKVALAQMEPLTNVQLWIRTDLLLAR